MLSLEYLRGKEIEDIRSLAEVFGQNPQIEEIILKTVNQRYEQFTKLFKENLENIETEIIEKMDTDEVLDFSDKIRYKKDMISKIIEETNMNSSLSKQELENALKENQIASINLQENNPKLENTSSCPVTHESIDEKTDSQSTKIESEETKIEIKEEKPYKKEINLSSVSKSLKEISKKEDNFKGPEILTTVNENRMKTISISEIANIEATMLSPIFSQAMNFPDINSPIFVEPARFPTENHSISPLPARPSAPLMFLDMDDCNISLESLLNSSTPNRKNFPGLPLLNLGNLPQPTGQPLTSDPRIETSSGFIRKFTEEIFQNIDIKDIEKLVSKGIQREPLSILHMIHENDLGSVVERGTYPCILNIQTIVDNLLDDFTGNDIETTQRFINKADRIHKIMILTVADELLQKYRPYGTKGMPMA